LLSSREKKRAHSSWRYIARTCKGRFMQQRHVAYDLLRSSTSSMFEKRSDPRRTGAAAVSRAHVVSTPSRTSTAMSRRAIAVTNAASSPAPRRQRDAGADSPAGSPSRLANEAVSHPGRAAPAAHLEPSPAAGSHPRTASRATSVPFTAVLTGLTRTSTDNLREARPALFPCRRR
jgi:hypothetical protein